MGQFLSCQKRAKGDANVSATVVVNMLTLEVVVQNIETAGESAGQTTAHETLLARARWKRNCCYGGAVQLGEFRAVSGYINGLREGYKAVTAPGYDGPYRAYGQLATNEPTEDLDAFRKFTKDKSNREKADIPEEARKKAVELAKELAADGQNSFMKAPFSMDPLLQADSLEYLSCFVGGVEDLNTSKEMLERVLMLREEYNGKDHVAVAFALNNLGRIFGKLGDQLKRRKVLERALEIDEKHYGEDHFVVAIVLTNLGNAHFALGDPKKTKELLKRALKIQEMYYGEDHFEVATTLTNLGNAYGNLGDQRKKRELLERALEIKVTHYGEEHFQVAITLFNLAVCHGSLGDHQKKAEILNRVLPIFHRHFGVRHEYSDKARQELEEAGRVR